VTGPSDLQVRTEGGVLRLHLDRESKRNALSGEVLDAMLAALREVAAEPADGWSCSPAPASGSSAPAWTSAT
jgi:enoyl-CoA hydratase/carnithine racemase